MGKQAWLLGMACASALVGACGGDDAASGPKLDEVPSMLSDAICNAYLDCLGPGLPKGLTVDACIDTNSAGIEDGDFQFIQAAVDAGRVVYNAGRVGKCIADIGAADCTALGNNRLPDSCKEAVKGTLAEGDDCALNAECAGDAYCKQNSQCPGTCTALGAAGDDCQSDDECRDGLVCGITGTCTMTAGEGDPCGGSAAECSLGLFCAGADESMNISGTCATADTVFAINEGDECSLTGGMLCKDNLSCAVTVTGTGQNTMVAWACEGDVEADADCKLAVPDQCPVGQYCDVNPSGVTPRFAGTCKDLPRAGQACSVWQGLCAEGSTCNSQGTCHAVNRIGGECSEDIECASETCNSGVCSAPATCDLGS